MADNSGVLINQLHVTHFRRTKKGVTALQVPVIYRGVWYRWGDRYPGKKLREIRATRRR